MAVVEEIGLETMRQEQQVTDPNLSNESNTSNDIESSEDQIKVIHNVECQFAGNVTQFKCCNSIGIKIRVLLICVVEMLAISYQLATTILIALNNNPSSIAWYTQPFMAVAWKHEFVAVLTVNLVIFLPFIAAIICLVQALDSNNPKLVIPHIVMQTVVIVLLIVLAIITFSVLSPYPNIRYARRVADLTAASLSNGVAGVGNMIYGLEKEKQREKKLQDFLRKHRRKPPPKQLSTASTADIKNVTESAANTTDTGQQRSVRSVPRRSNDPLKRRQNREKNLRDRIWHQYDAGIWLLVGMITYFSAAGIEMIALIVVMQCYYYLIELKKISDLV